jgi:hypothetical protein
VLLAISLMKDLDMGLIYIEYISRLPGVDLETGRARTGGVEQRIRGRTKFRGNPTCRPSDELGVAKHERSTR